MARGHLFSGLVSAPVKRIREGPPFLDAWAIDGVWMRRARAAQLGLRGLLNRKDRWILALENGAAASEASHPIDSLRLPRSSRRSLFVLKCASAKLCGGNAFGTILLPSNRNRQNRR
jgi:hypothetical protein